MITLLSSPEATSALVRAEAPLLARGAVSLEGRLPLGRAVADQARALGIGKVAAYLNAQFAHQCAGFGGSFRSDESGLLLVMDVGPGHQSLRNLQMRLRRFQRCHDRWVHAADSLVGDSIRRLRRAAVAPECCGLN